MVKAPTVNWLVESTMANIVVQLPGDTERTLREKAARSGLTVETYLRQLAERDAAQAPGHPAQMSADEFDRLLDELAAGPGLPRLPSDFARSDIYADHD
jgi:hypothetical protein